MIYATQNHEEQATSKPPFRPPVRRIAIWAPLIVVLVLALGLIYGIWRHIQQERLQQQFAQQTSGVSVEYVELKREAKPHDLLLPGTINAVEITTIYARVNGYVARWLVDIGDLVKEGQVLLEIDTPELDQQLAQARQQLSQAEANFELARVTAQRWSELFQRLVVSKQDNDTKQSAYQASADAMNAAKANVAQLEETQAFKHVRAPFPGRITSRAVYIGALVSAGSGMAGTPLYGLAKTNPLDIFINVPQTNAPSIADGAPVQLLVEEYAGREFIGKVIRSAHALDPVSRTLLTEVEIPNEDGALYSGMYVTAKFKLQDTRALLLIPADAFVFNADGPRVATVTKDGHIHWQSIQVGRDFGPNMEALAGLNEGDRLVINPTDDLKEGLAVQAKPAEKQGANPNDKSAEKGEAPTKRK
jgi:RND family efflux transporter MFP subunit